MLSGGRLETMCATTTSKTRPRAGADKRNPHADRPGRPSHAHRRGATQGRRRVGRGSQAVAVGCVNANLAGHDSHGVIAIPTYIDRIKVGHIVPGAKWTIVQEIPDHDRDRRPLGFRLLRQRQGNGADDREGEDRQRRGLHGVSPEPCRTAGRLSDDGDARGHDRACHRRFRPLAQSTSRRSAAARRGSAPIRSRSRCRRISRRRSIWTWRRRQSRPERSSSRPRAARKFRPAGSSTAKDGKPPIRAIPQGRRAAAARRHRRLQGQRPGRDGRGAVRAAHRPGLRRRADRPAQ